MVGVAGCMAGEERLDACCVLHDTGQGECDVRLLVANIAEMQVSGRILGAHHRLKRLQRRGAHLPLASLHPRMQETAFGIMSWLIGCQPSRPQSANPLSAADVKMFFALDNVP